LGGAAAVAMNLAGDRGARRRWEEIRRLQPVSGRFEGGGEASQRPAAACGAATASATCPRARER